MVAICLELRSYVRGLYLKESLGKGNAADHGLTYTAQSIHKAGPLEANLHWSGSTVDQVATFCKHACQHFYYNAQHNIMHMWGIAGLYLMIGHSLITHQC